MGSFSILTNVASLQAQNYLRINENFQNETINQVTSGQRIVNSGDDAAGLAVANGMAADEAVLTQGIQNASQGLNQLQIADGGMSNISQLLDRAETLATESASGTFTGDRGTLNDEFQSVLGEIDRQAQSIGLNQGGTFAQNLSVFIGGGKATTDAGVITNGSVSVNLGTATVDTKSLGLKGVQATNATSYDIGTGSATTSVQDILNNTTNTGSEANQGYTTFNFYGPGFSGITGQTGSNPIQVSVNLSGVTDTTTLAAAINSAIQNAGNANTQEATAFKNANITASVVTSSSGQQQLAFGSSTTAFQVQGADQVATAFMGQFSSVATATGVNPNSTVATNSASSAAVGGTYKLRVISSAFTNGYNDYSVTTTANQTTAQIAADITAALATGPGNLANLTVSSTGAGNITFTGPAGATFQVEASGDVNNDMGLGTWQSSGGGSTGNFYYNTITAAAAPTASKTQDVQISLAGGATVDLGTVSSGAAISNTVTNLNAAIQSNATLKAAGLTATTNAAGTDVELYTTTGANFRVNVVGANNAFGFGTTGADSTDLGNLTSTVAAPVYVNSSGAYMSVNGGSGNGVSAPYEFNNLTTPTDKQTISISALDSSGTAHPLTVNLTSANANSVDAAVDTINTALQQSDDSTLQGIVAVATQTASGTGIQFMDATNQFSVSLGQTANGVGLGDANQSNEQGEILTAQVAGTGSTVDINSQATAESAVTALTNAVAQLGNAQATVGRGENQFNYAINLAQSELTNTQAAESTIKDADLAAESANLTKAQILIQAGVAALAQANSAPQQVLSLLQHP